MSDTPETDAQLTIFTSISKLKKHFVNRTGTVSAEFARNLERQRNQFETDLWSEETEHRMTKTTLSALAAERNQLRRALAQVAEDCTAWLHSESDEPSVEFVKAVRQYAHEQSQAPLDTANCQLPTANSTE